LFHFFADHFGANKKRENQKRRHDEDNKKIRDGARVFMEALKFCSPGKGCGGVCFISILSAASNALLTLGVAMDTFVRGELRKFIFIRGEGGEMLKMIFREKVGSVCVFFFVGIVNAT
jgi:hypothetical protein